MNQWDFTAPHEGIVPCLYKDTEGYVTFGVGCRVFTKNELKSYPWTPNVQDAFADYELLKDAPAGKLPPFYLKLCRARVSPTAMREIFDRRVADMRPDMIRDWQFSLQPQPVQLALMDMRFNMGSAGLNAFKKLKAAVRSRNWLAAAEECHRKPPVSETRNEATRQLFLQAAKENL